MLLCSDDVACMFADVHAPAQFGHDKIMDPAVPTIKQY
jgi:hypothetical protein